jgi:hypothetical protein
MQGLREMKLEKSILEKSHFYFFGFFIIVVAAFWLTYITRIFDQENYRMHLHGITLFLWCSMLVVQPLLIRKKRYAIHRRLGKFSYVLVPVLIITTLDLLRYRIRSQPAVDYVFVALVFNALVAFAIFYGLAIYNRKRPAIHARFMLCSVFPFFTPATDRIISIYFPWTLEYFPVLNGQPNVMLFGFALADIILVGLCLWDWISHRRLNVFPLALIILLTYHWSVNSFHQYNFWKVFSDWIIHV